jgi:hypothetical protein
LSVGVDLVAPSAETVAREKLLSAHWTLLDAAAGMVDSTRWGQTGVAREVLVALVARPVLLVAPTDRLVRLPVDEQGLGAAAPHFGRLLANFAIRADRYGRTPWSFIVVVF